MTSVARAADEWVLDARSIEWQQVREEPSFDLVLERHRYTNLDRAARFVIAVQMGTKKERWSESLSVEWTLSEGDTTLVTRTAAMDAGMVAVSLDLSKRKPGMYTVRAVGRNGDTVIADQSKSFELTTVAAPPQFGRVGIIFPKGLKSRGLPTPVQFGVPMPKGAVSDASHLRLVDKAGRVTPAHFAVRSRWGHRPDASIRWLSVDTQVDGAPAYWPDRSEPVLFLEYGPRVASPSPITRVSCTPTEHGFRVDTGVMQFQVRRDRFNLLDQVQIDGKAILQSDAEQGAYLVDHEGSVYRAALDRQTKLTVEEANPMRVVLRAEGWYVKEGTDGSQQLYTLPTDKLCRFVTRLEACAGQRSVRVLHTWILTHDTFTVRLRDVGLSLPLSSAATAHFGVTGGEPVQADVQRDGVYLVQHLPDRFDIQRGGGDAIAQGERSDGTMLVQSDTGMIGLAVRELWQRFPKELEVLPDRLRLHVWPAHGKDHPDIDPFARDEIHRLWFAHQGQELNLKMPWETYMAAAAFADNPSGGVYKPAGMAMAGVHASAMGTAITTDFQIHFDNDANRASAVADTFLSVPHALPDPQWLSDSLAMGYVQPYAPKQYALIERIIHDGMRGYWATQDAAREWGMWLYRPWHHLGYEGDGKLELYRLYNATHHYEAYLPWMFYARSGDPFYFTQGSANMRLLTDVQMIHHVDRDYPHQEFHSQQKRVLGSTRHTNGFSTWGGDHSVLGHLTCYNGVLTAYYLTGDLRLREVIVDEWQSTLLDRRDDEESLRASRAWREGRDNNNALGELIDLYQFTYDPRLLAYMGPMQDRYLQDMKNWGLPLEKLLLFDGSPQAAAQLIEACDVWRTTENKRPLQSPQEDKRPAHRLFNGHGHASLFLLASLYKPDGGYEQDGVDMLGLLNWLTVTRRIMNLEPGAIAFCRLADELLYLPRVMYGLNHRLPDLTFDAHPSEGWLMLANRKHDAGYARIVVREERDQAFNVQLLGAANAEVQIFGPDGKHIVTATTGDNPAIAHQVNVAADGITGEYVVFAAVPNQNQTLATPLTELPGEVYVSRYGVVRPPTRLFTRSPGAEPIKVSLNPRQQGKIIDAVTDEVLAETTNEWMDADVGPNGVWIDLQSRYVSMRDDGAVVFSLDAARWFMPSETSLVLKPVVPVKARPR